MEDSLKKNESDTDTLCEEDKSVRAVKLCADDAFYCNVNLKVLAEK